MKVSFIMPCRNKAPHVAEAVRSVFDQTYTPMELVFSDQGSTDGTTSILERLVNDYNGPNRVRLLNCPEIELRGMPGLNANLNWIDRHIEGDVVITSSADDLNDPYRAEYVVRAFKEFNPSYVCTGVKYTEPDGSDLRFTHFPEIRDRWLGTAECFKYQIHSSGSSAWARDLWEKHGPLKGCEQQDMILPAMALFERGIYYVDKPLHTYINHADVANTGFQGQIRAADDEEERAQLVELNNFMNVKNWTEIFRRIQEQPGWIERMDQLAVAALLEKITACAFSWAQVRETLIMATPQIPPMPMRI